MESFAQSEVWRVKSEVKVCAGSAHDLNKLLHARKIAIVLLSAPLGEKND